MFLAYLHRSLERADDFFDGGFVSSWRSETLDFIEYVEIKAGKQRELYGFLGSLCFVERGVLRSAVYVPIVRDDHPGLSADLVDVCHVLRPAQVSGGDRGARVYGVGLIAAGGAVAIAAAAGGKRDGKNCRNQKKKPTFDR